MPYARLNEEGRMVQWSHDRLDGLDVEFSNGEYVDENCADGLDDFVIRDGMAVFEPLPEKEAARLEAMVGKANVTLAKMLLDMMTAKNLGQLLQVFSGYLEAHREEFEELKACIARLDELKGK